MPATPEAPAEPPIADDRVVFEWSPSGVVTTMWVAMSILLGLLGLMLFGLLYALLGPVTTESGITFDAPVVVAISVIVLILHQLIHAAVSRLLGGSPTFVVDVVQLIFPVLFCRVSGQRFSRAGYLTYLLAPLLALTILGTGFLLLDSHGALLIIPLALNLGMSMRDIWMAWVVWRHDDDVEVEARADGFLLLRPRD